MIALKNIKGLLIDYGGTIDTDGIHWFEVFCAMYEKAGIAVSKEALRNAYIFGERKMAIDYQQIKTTDTFYDILVRKTDYQLNSLVEENDLPKIEKTKHDALVEYCYQFAKQTTARQAKVLQQLSNQFSLVLVSNFYGNLQSVLHDFEIEKYFQTIIESSVVGIRKPNPQIFQLGIDALKLKPNEIAVIGDSYKNDIEPAKQLDCATVWLKKIGWEIDENITHTADFIIDTFEKLIH